MSSMTLEGIGSYRKKGNRCYVYIPTPVAADSQFPLKEEKGKVKVKIEGGKVVIEPGD